MERILSLLDQRNHYFEKFFSVNEEELKKFSAGNFEGLDRFYSARENILKIIKYVESEIEFSQHHLDNNYIPTREEKNRIRASLAAKKQYVEHILQQDLRILEFIESFKSQVIRELQDVRKARRAANGYKSSLTTTRLMEDL